MGNDMRYFIEKIEQIKKDDKQYEAYLTNDSTVVIAGPGSGKTTILTLKIMRLLNEKIKAPRGLACVTFSREAAREFKERLYRLGYQDRSNVFLGTVHSFCISEVLGNFAHLYDYGIPLPIKIIPAKNKKQLFDKIVSDFNMESVKLKMIEMDKERTLNIKGLSSVETPSYDVALKVAQEYEKRLHAMGYVDYESIIKFSTLLIQEQEYVRRCLSAKFPWIVIDEYQDLGRPLHEMILSLFTTTDIKIFAVGDPDQSIYSFSGAIPDYLDELYKRKDIIPIELKTNYRSNQEIIDGSEVVLNAKRTYKAATRLDEKAEFMFISCEEDMRDQYDICVNKIIPYYLSRGIPLEEIAVLVKVNQEIRDLSEFFIEKNIPYYIAKHLFDRTDIVKWLESCAAWVCGINNESFSDIYMFWERTRILHLKLNHLNDRKRIIEKRELYDVLLESKQYVNNLKQWVECILAKLLINDLLKDSEIYPDELENLENLIMTLGDEKYKKYDLTKFSRLGKPEKQVTLTTRHSSKGLEFEVVIMLGVEKGKFPSFECEHNPQKLEEEHRICFVCVSRAKKACVLVRSRVNNIQKKDGGIWRKITEESIFWTYLVEKYGNELNEELFD